MFGCIVERTWGARKFLFYYIACGIGAGLFQELAQMVQFYLLAAEQIQGFTLSQTMLVVKANAMFLNAWTTVGASGAIYGILLAFGMLYPEERLFIFPLPVPIKAKWFVLIYAAIELFMRRRGTLGTSRRYGCRILPHTLLAPPSRHQLQPSWRTAVLRLSTLGLGATLTPQRSRQRTPALGLWPHHGPYCPTSRDRCRIQRAQAMGAGAYRRHTRQDKTFGLRQSEQRREAMAV